MNETESNDYEGSLDKSLVNSSRNFVPILNHNKENVRCLKQ